MKKYEQCILRFPLWDNEAKIAEIQKKLSEKGQEGFRLINVFTDTLDPKSGRAKYLICIMEREIS